jgi:DNA replication and repair protein RecF
MIVRSVTLSHLRNHDATTVQCARDVTVITGRNGSGKTSILEAVSLCAIGRSFVPVPDSALVQVGYDGYAVAVKAERDTSAPYAVSVVSREGTRRKIESTFGSNLSTRDLIGAMPMVALSPDHKGVTFGPPAERRSFVDAVMAQCTTRYRDLLYEHRRLLKQRNAVLADLQKGLGSRELLTTWTDAIIACGAEITDRRRRFLVDLEPIVAAAYADVSGGAESVSITYEPDAGSGDTDGDVEADVELMRARAASVAEAEIRRGVTLFGPQKDEIAFALDGRLVRETASQGQHKSLLIALAIAECTLLEERTRERPVVLLDDLFSELDRHRGERVLQRVLSMGMQCFVTSTDGEEIVELIEQNKDVRLVRVANGMIEEE